MVIKRNLNTKRRGRSNSRRNGYTRPGNFDNKPKGNISKILERYLSLAREANSNGDKIKAEGFYQYAEHYQRVLNSQPIKNISKDKDSTEQKEVNENLSRTERAESAKIKRIGEANKYRDKNKFDESLPQDNDNKTADGVEALKAFNTSEDKTESNDN